MGKNRRKSQRKRSSSTDETNKDEKNESAKDTTVDETSTTEVEANDAEQTEEKKQPIASPPEDNDTTKEQPKNETSDDNETQDNENNETKDAITKETTPTATPTTTPTPPPHTISDGRYRNKQRCLTISSRGVTARHRHLLEDLRTLLPHHKKESKLDAGRRDSLTAAVNDIATIKGCNSLLFVECRKRTDGYLWMGLTPGGPSAKFQLMNVHTMDELRMTGNGMKGSRPVLSFDESFGRVEHLKLLRVLIEGVFGTPRGHPKSKPFVDRVMAFYWADDKIWVRHYQILEETASNAKEAAQLQQGGLNTSLVEIGPRFVLNPIRIFAHSLGGPTLYANPKYVPPNEVRANLRKKRGRDGESMEEKVIWKKRREERRKGIRVVEDPLGDVFR